MQTDAAMVIARPRERLRSAGADALACEELIALLIGTGRRGASATECAREILVEAGGLVPLSRLRASELALLPNLGVARAARLAAAFALGRRALSPDASPAPTVAGPDDVALLMHPRLVGLGHESFWVLALNVKNQLIDCAEIARGSLTAVDVHPRELFRFLTRVGAAAGIAVHNHPSGDANPSREDVELTERLVLSGQLLGIPLLDHLVIGQGSYRSILSPPELERAPAPAAGATRPKRRGTR